MNDDTLADQTMSKRIVAGLQSLYYLPTGIWPIIHIDSFEWVTGEKTDDWLVKTVASLIIAIGVTLLYAYRRNQVAPETVVLGIGAAVALGLIDVIYVTLKVISPIYLLDAVGEVILIGMWIVAVQKESKQQPFN